METTRSLLDRLELSFFTAVLTTFSATLLLAAGREVVRIWQP